MPPRRTKRRLPPKKPPPSLDQDIAANQPRSRVRGFPVQAPSAAASKKRKQEPKQKVYVRVVKLSDVLKGRGPGFNKHDGNVEFRKRVKKYIKRYRQAGKTAKTEICQEILDDCKQNGIRFLEKDKNNGRWFHVTDHTARTKAGQTIQDIIKELREKGLLEEFIAGEGEEVEDEEEGTGTSDVMSEGEGSQEGSNADESEQEDDEDEGEGDEQDDDDDDDDEYEQEDLKLPAVPADMGGRGTESVSVHEAVSATAAAFPAARAASVAQGDDEDSLPGNRRPQAELRPSTIPFYQRQLPIEEMNDSEKGSLHDSDESR